MKIKMLLAIVGTFFMLLAGCESRPVGSSGYAELTDSEKAELVKIARNVIRQEDSEIQGSQLNYILNSEPEMRIFYRGDCYGRATLTWQLPRKYFRVSFSGLLNSRDSDELIVRYSVLRETGQETVRDPGPSAQLREALEFTREEWESLKKQ